MATMIDADLLFKELMERSRRHHDKLITTYQLIGEAAYKGKEVDDYSRGSVREYEARENEIDEIVKIMQRISREAGNG